MSKRESSTSREWFARHTKAGRALPLDGRRLSQTFLPSKGLVGERRSLAATCLRRIVFQPQRLPCPPSERVQNEPGGDLANRSVLVSRSTMREELLIRSAQQDDLQMLLDLYRHLDPSDVRCRPEEAMSIFSRFLLYPGSAILIGMSGQVCVASCALVVIPNLTRGGKPFGLIENVVTHADYRNLGFGKSLLKAATERAWDAGCYKVMLLTGSKKLSTKAFYESAGFAQTKAGFQIRRHPERAE